MFGLVLSS